VRSPRTRRIRHDPRTEQLCRFLPIHSLVVLVRQSSTQLVRRDAEDSLPKFQENVPDSKN
jgi:hypothetical protein